jgi:exopolysaccharide biosynthesis polyprenyl glycosylphosphotransferase
MSSSGAPLPPGLVAKVNLCFDLTLFLVALPVAAALSGTVSRHYADLTWFAISGSAAWIVAATALRHYDPWAWADRDVLDDAALVSVLVMSVTTILGTIKLLTPSSNTLPGVGYFLLVFWPSVLSLRLLAFRVLAKREAPLQEVVIVGTGPLGRCTWEDLQRRSRQRVIGYLRFPDEDRCEAIRARFLGETTELGTVLRTTGVDEVYIAGNTLRQAEAMQRAIRECERFGVPFALPAYSIPMHRARPANAHAIRDGYVHYLSFDPKPRQMALKRLFDIVASGIAVWLVSPLFPLLALAIKLTSHGPVFFKQVRVGLNGKPFHMLKFRSMVMNAEALRDGLEVLNEQSGPVFKIKADPRITSIGRWMRKYSIDELPQLINVLRGEMSVVGPRPPVPSEVENYEPWQRRRLSVRPGLTCIWQVSGRNQISFEQWMYLDLQYIDNWSLVRDFNLIFKTLPVVVTGRGAS